MKTLTKYKLYFFLCMYYLFLYEVWVKFAGLHEYLP